MNRIAKQTAFYRGYLADNRSLVPLTVLLAAAVPIWLLVYLFGTASDARQDSGPAYSGTEIFIRDHQAAKPARLETCDSFLARGSMAELAQKRARLSREAL
jgi:hypothetical protein